MQSARFFSVNRSKTEPAVSAVLAENFTARDQRRRGCLFDYSKGNLTLHGLHQVIACMGKDIRKVVRKGCSSHYLSVKSGDLTVLWLHFIFSRF